MGPLVPIFAGIGSAIGGGLSAISAATGIGAATGTAATAAAGGLAAGATAGTVLGGLTAVSGAVSLAQAGLALSKGAPKPPPAIAPPTQAAVPAPTILGAATTAQRPSAGSKSLAALSPGLALGGTGGLNAASPSGAKKTLLGQ